MTDTITTTTPLTGARADYEMHDVPRYDVAGFAYLIGDARYWQPYRWTQRSGGNIFAERNHGLLTSGETLAYVWEHDPREFYTQTGFRDSFAEAIWEEAHAHNRALSARQTAAETTPPPLVSTDAIRIAELQAQVTALQSQVRDAEKSKGIAPEMVSFWATAMKEADDLGLCAVFERVSMGIGGPSRSNQLAADSPEAAAFWERAEELARDHGVLSDYNRLAEAMGGPTVSRSGYAEVTVSLSYTVSVPVDDVDDYYINKDDIAEALNSADIDMMHAIDDWTVDEVNEDD